MHLYSSNTNLKQEVLKQIEQGFNFVGKTYKITYDSGYQFVDKIVSLKFEVDKSLDYNYQKEFHQMNESVKVLFNFQNEGQHDPALMKSIESVN